MPRGERLSILSRMVVYFGFASPFRQYYTADSRVAGTFVLASRISGGCRSGSSNVRPLCWYKYRHPGFDYGDWTRRSRFRLLVSRRPCVTSTRYVPKCGTCNRFAGFKRGRRQRWVAHQPCQISGTFMEYIWTRLSLVRLREKSTSNTILFCMMRPANVLEGDRRSMSNP